MARVCGPSFANVPVFIEMSVHLAVKQKQHPMYHRHGQIGLAQANFGAAKIVNTSR
jgi:hypothetical protein